MMRLGLALVALLGCGCRGKSESTPGAPSAAIAQAPAPKAASAAGVKIEAAPFSFQISSGADQYQIEGYIALAKETGPLPAVIPRCSFSISE